MAERRKPLSLTSRKIGLLLIVILVGIPNDCSGADGGCAGWTWASRRGRGLLGGLHLPADGRPGVGAFSADEAGGGVERERSEGLRASGAVLGKYDLAVAGGGGGGGPPCREV